MSQYSTSTSLLICAMNEDEEEDSTQKRHKSGPDGLDVSLPSSARLFQRRVSAAAISSFADDGKSPEMDSFNMEHNAEATADDEINEDDILEEEHRKEASTDTGISSEESDTVKVAVDDTVQLVLDENGDNANADKEESWKKETKQGKQSKLGAGAVRISLSARTERSFGPSFWQQVAGGLNKAKGNNRVHVAGEDINSEDVDQLPQRRRSVIRTAKQIRSMRKKVSIKSQGKKSNQEDLAMAAVEGNMNKVSEIVEAYIALYGGEGFKIIMRYRYDIDPRTLEISCVESPLAADSVFRSPTGVTVDMFEGLSILHIACAFDQEQVLGYFIRYGKGSLLNLATPSGQTLLHTSAWYGTTAPLIMLVAQGADIRAVNAQGHQPLHLSAFRGHISCLRELIRAGASLESTDESGNSPLHAAALAGSAECVRELLLYDVDVNMANDVGGTPLHYCNSAPLVASLMSYGADPNLMLKEKGDDNEECSKSAFDSFLETLPEGCSEILNKYVSSNGRSMGAQDLEFCYEYELFLREFERRPHLGEIATLLQVVAADQREVLKHPVCESFLHMKWDLVKNFFTSYLVFYLMFLIFLTTLVLLQFSPVLKDFEHKDVTSLILSVATAVCLGLLFLKGLMLALYNVRMYVQSIQNILEVLLILTGIVFLLVLELGDPNGEIRVHVAAVLIFVAWVNFTLLLGNLPSAGIYINMIVRISRDVVKFITLYVSTLIAFGLSLHVLSNHLSVFGDPWGSILCTLAMMVGEISFADVFTGPNVRHQWTTQVLFVLFLLVVSVIMMNLLIGLAISNINSQFQQAGIYRLRMTALLVRMIGDVVHIVRRLLPCCFNESMLFNYLALRQGTIEEPRIYVYPNRSKEVVFVRDQHWELVKTKFTLPPWIIENTIKLMRAETTAKTTAAAAENKQQEDKINRLSLEVRAVKKDVAAIKADMQSVLFHVQGNRAAML